MPSNDLTEVFSKAIIVFRFVFLMWLFFAVEFVYGYQFHRLGLLPRNVYGLLGLFTAPVLHINGTHIVSNTVPLLFLGAMLFYFYQREARLVFLSSYFITNVLVWLFARPVMHVGASGIIYGMAFFLVLSGLLRKNVKSLIIAIVVVLVYSGLFLGLITDLSIVSYEMHIAGAIVGTLVALYTNSKYYAISK